jgi:N-glycosidase YbiA
MSTSMDAMSRTKGAVHDDQNIKGFFGPYRYLSNFHPVQMTVEGIKYPSLENAYMAHKTEDIEIRKQIAELTPNEAKKAGRILRLRPNWDKIKFDIMLMLLKKKFSTDPMRSALLSTGDKYLEETNWWGDKIWGVSNGVGDNNLGKLLMVVRSELAAPYLDIEELSEDNPIRASEEY